MRQFMKPLDILSTCTLYPAATCSVSASPEELRKIGLQWEMTSGFLSRIQLFWLDSGYMLTRQSMELFPEFRAFSASRRTRILRSVLKEHRKFFFFGR